MSEATISNPLETSETYSYLSMPIISIWLADRGTGHVFGKYDRTGK